MDLTEAVLGILLIMFSKLTSKILRQFIQY